MTKALTILAVFTAAAFSTPATAGEKCAEPIATWHPRSAVAKLAEDNGWTVRRVKIDDGCYEVYAYDTSGRQIEVKVNPATLEILDIEVEDEHDDDHHPEEDHGDEDQHES